ncbi:MAG: caspase family protein [Flavobacteriales bacterium]|nr:caspase family protein [Bacteroidota bacterium]MCB9240536.1 caspase family protein [Flavobacteriales bacterium]
MNRLASIFLLFLLFLAPCVSAQSIIYQIDATLYRWNPTEKKGTPFYSSPIGIKDFQTNPNHTILSILDSDGAITWLDASGQKQPQFKTDHFNTHVPHYNMSGSHYVIENSLYQSEENRFLRNHKVEDFMTREVCFVNNTQILLNGHNTETDLLELILLDLTNQRQVTRINLPFEYARMLSHHDINAAVLVERFGYGKLNFAVYSFASGELVSHSVNYTGEEPTRIIPEPANPNRFYMITPSMVFTINLASLTVAHTMESDSSIITGISSLENSVVQSTWNPHQNKTRLTLSHLDTSAPASHPANTLTCSGKVTHLEWLRDHPRDTSAPAIGQKIQRQQDIEYLYYSDHGNYLLSYSDDHHLTLWDSRSLRQIRRFPCKLSVYTPNAVQFDEAQNKLACLCEQENYRPAKIHIYDLTSGDLRETVSPRRDIGGYSLQQESYFIGGGLFDKPILHLMKFNGKHLLSWKGRYHQPTYLDSRNQWAVIQKGKKVSILAATSTKPIKSFKKDRKAKYIYDYKLSADGQKLLMVSPLDAPIFSGGKHLWKVYDIQRKKVIARGTLPFGSTTIEFSANSKSVYFIHFTDSLNTEGFNLHALYRMDLENGAWHIMHEYDAFGGVSTFALHPNGDFAQLSVEGDLYSINLNRAQLERTSPKTIRQEYTRLDLYDDGQKGLLRNDMGLHLIDFANPSRYALHTVPNNTGPMFHLLGSGYWIEEDTANYWEEGDDYRVTYALLSETRETKPRFIQTSNEIISYARIMPDRKQVILVTYGVQDTYILSLYNLHTGQRSTGYEFSDIILNTSFFDDLEISADGNRIWLPVSDDGENAIFVFSLAGADVVLTHKIPGFNCALFTPNINELIVGKSHYAGSELLRYQLDQKLETRIGIHPENINNLILSHDGKTLISITKNRFYRFALDHSVLESSQPHHLYYPLGATANADGFMVYDYNEVIQFSDEGRERYRLVSSSDQGVVMLLPEGKYFVYSGKKPDYLNYIIKGSAYGFDQFDLQFNRPDAVLKTMGKASPELIALYHKARQKRLASVGSPSVMDLNHLPQLNIQRQLLPLVTTDSFVFLEVAAHDSFSNLRSLNIWVNNVPIYGNSGKVITSGKTFKSVVAFALCQGWNLVEISVTNEQGVESLRERFEITANYELSQPPVFHFVSISVSEYQDQRFNLRYAVKDGRDMRSVFEQQQLGYRFVADSFFDQHANRDKVLNLRKRLMNSGVNDVVVLFVSGHGILDEDFNWYFATHDMDFEHPVKRGMAYADLEGLLDGIPARKKLLLVDACHSGEVDKESMLPPTTIADSLKLETQNFKGGKSVSQSDMGLLNSFNLMQDVFVNLNRGSGAQVLAAAAGNSYALESDRWKNGVFTFALRQALEDYRADANSDGLITVTELQNFVRLQVSALTRGAQVPVMRQENLEFDFGVLAR